MRAGRRLVLPLLLSAGLLLASCGPAPSPSAESASPSTPGDGPAGEPTESDRLLEALTKQADYEFEASVFVLSDDDLQFSGPVDRRYSFDSITKTMTGLLLAELHTDGRLRLDTPIGELLSAGPNSGITMLELATHTSGLPETADNWDDWEGFTDEQPYAGYTAAMAEEALPEAELDEEVGYSNYAFQLLGMCVEAASSQTLGDLAATLIFEPAGMNTAEIPEGRRDLPDGLFDGEPASAWDNLLTGDGGAGGTIADLAAYAEFVMDPPAESADAVELATTAHITDTQGYGSGLDWFIEPNGTIWHAGASDAYNSLVVIDRANRRAVGYLTATGDLDDAAIELFMEHLAA